MAALRKRRAVAETEQSADSQAQLEFENTVNESNEPQESMGENQIFVDSLTGVNYFYHNSGYSGGLTVLVDKDGKNIGNIKREHIIGQAWFCLESKEGMGFIH